MSSSGVPIELFQSPALKEMPKLKIEQAEGPKAQEMRKLLGRLLRVTLTDGRVLVGRLRVFDKLKNIILVDTMELWTVQKIAEPLLGEIEPEPSQEAHKKEWQKRKDVLQLRHDDLKQGVERRPAGAVLILGNTVVKVELDEKSVPDVKPSLVARDPSTVAHD